MTTPRDEARRRWELVAAGATSDPDVRAWLQRVARAMCLADELPDGNARHLTIVEATGLQGKRTRLSGMPFGLAFRALQSDRDRLPEPVARLDDDLNEIDEHVTRGQALAHERAHANAQQRARRDPLQWLGAAVGVWGLDDTPDDTRRETFRRRVNRYLQGVDEPTRSEFRALLQPAENRRT